ncbi:hypothetical protein ABIF93_006823 [Bradyrhizobium japonicum]
MLSPAKITVRSDDGSIPFRKSRPAAAPELPAILGEGVGAPRGRGCDRRPRRKVRHAHADSQATGTATRSNPSGSGTSTSGGRDDNGDAGPESNRTMRPESQLHHPDDK